MKNKTWVIFKPVLFAGLSLLTGLDSIVLATDEILNKFKNGCMYKIDEISYKYIADFIFVFVIIGEISNFKYLASFFDAVVHLIMWVFV